MKQLRLFSTLALGGFLFFLNSCKKEDNNNNTTCGSSKCTHTLQAGETAGTTPASIVGKHSLTYDEIKSGGPFKEGDKADFELTSDNKLIVTYNNDCITLENPVQTSPSEVSFKDNCKHQVSFAASKTNNGSLNEININALDGTFYGQFR